MNTSTNGHNGTLASTNGKATHRNRNEQSTKGDLTMNSSLPLIQEPQIEVNAYLDQIPEEWLRSEEERVRMPWHDRGSDRIRLNLPMLVIALGGTGRVVATKMKAALIEMYGVVPENVSFLGFDSADEPIDTLESRSGRVVRLEPEGEFFLFDRTPVAGIKQHPERHKAIVDRLGNSLYKINRPSIHNGAVQERPQGLLAFAWSYGMVLRQVENRIRLLTGRGDLLNEINRKSGINVLITGSIPGGQGSGSILDTAYLVRHVLENLGEQADASRILGLLVLPGAFVGVQEGNLKPNAHAFSLELDHLMRHRRFEAIYPNGTRINSYESPFDQTVVLEGIDELGRSYQDHSEVCTMGAQAMVMLLGTDVGQREIANSINARYAMQKDDAGIDDNYLSTVGQAVIRFPARISAKRCTLRHAQTMISNYLMQSPVKTQIAALKPVSGLAGMRERLLTDAHDVPHRIELIPPSSLDQIDAADVPGQARALARNFQDRRIHNDVYVQMKEKMQAQEQALHRALVDDFRALVAQAQVPLLLHWLVQVQQEIELHINAWNSDLARLTEQIEQSRAAVETAGSALDQAAASFAGIPFTEKLRRARVRPALAIYIDEVNRSIAAQVEQRATELSIEILRHLLLWVEDQQRSVQSVVARLQQANDRLKLRETELGRLTGGRHEINLADDQLIDELYHEYAGQIEPYVHEALKATGGLLTWAQLRPDQLGSLLAHHASIAFRPVSEISVEEILNRLYGERSLHGWVSQIEALAAGAWNLDRSLLPGGGSGLAGFTLLGVPNKDNSLFVGSDQPLISTFDNERIIALRTIYGASFKTLRSTPKWRAAYEAVAGRVPLHILPTFLKEDDRSLECFALAIVFDHIENRGNWFYFKSQDPLEENLRLGQGLEKALAGFAQSSAEGTEVHRNLCAVLDERVSEAIARNGLRWAIDKIDAYVAAGNSKDDELTQKLRKAARIYAAELRRNMQATLGAE